MKRILVHEFLSGGGLADANPALQAELMPMGLAMRDAMLADLMALPDLRITATCCDAAPLPPASQPHRLRSARAASDEDPLAFLARQAAQHDLVWVVAPESEGLLQRCLQTVGAARWLGCDAHSLQVASSKRATLAALRGAGCLTPQDFSHAPDTAHWVVKPDDGAGAVQTQRFALWAQAQAHALQRQRQGEVVVLEPWVGGEAMSLSLMCQAGTAELLSINQQHIRIADQGQVVFDGVSALSLPAADPRRLACARLARDVASALPGLRGFVGVDLVWHATRGAVAIEVNPRVTCAYVGLSRHLARNLAADVLASHTQTAHQPEAQDAHA
jgi:predicted ATP-grasp superfamily ATP-dependent carboligase